MTPGPSYEEVRAAAARISTHVPPTPVLRSAAIDAWAGTRVHLKAEHLHATGAFKLRGATNAVLHPWLEAEVAAILATLPEPPAQTEAERRAAWERWQEGLTIKFTLPDRLPPLRMLLVLDNLSGHKTPALVLWLVEHGVMPLYTPLSGSWLNMAESIQRILVRRALTGETPSSPDDIID